MVLVQNALLGLGLSLDLMSDLNPEDRLIDDIWRQRRKAYMVHGPLQARRPALRVWINLDDLRVLMRSSRWYTLFGDRPALASPRQIFGEELRVAPDVSPGEPVVEVIEGR
jgi:hypothetical protein